MNDRKHHVIKMAHQLFIEKGFQATSIQDILDYSGISKGTFYNYFSSKNELLMALFKKIYKQLEQDRNELLVGQDHADINIFAQQMELNLKTNRTNKLITLFEEVIFSNDPDLNQFIKRGHLMMLRWLYQRFLDIFGEEKQPYLLDAAIMFLGILQHQLKYNALAHGGNTDYRRIVRYSVKRIVKIVEEVAASGEQLLQPAIMEQWLPDNSNSRQALQRKIHHATLQLKKDSNHHVQQAKYNELLDFLQDELLHTKHPRKFLIGSTLSALESGKHGLNKDHLQQLKMLIADYYKVLEETQEQ
ncbi:TetR/AcrR family transcriptional regulator [Mesobacillus zeae]|uniref:TetR/AcrR family transcriptional regulator n=1 Tax=Mesobacillus zeae TaxID=1917180 RepID=A0A398BJ67_9BACI|nr:TetR/AcrR family transcriptional regulator [Mesobacillus zeae]RID87496.1 TetR/AcrR family transcriptional regulator [Mesobacillus zeae]